MSLITRVKPVRFLRLVLVFLTLTSFVLTCWSTLAPRAYAATYTRHASATTHTHTHVHYQSASQVQQMSHPATSLTHPRTHLSTSPLNGLGNLRSYTYVKQRINDRKALAINVANGNLLLSCSDLTIKGTGLDLTIASFYNSGAATSTTSDLGPRWSLSAGADVFLQFNSDGSITFFGPSGYAATYPSDGSGGYLDAPALNATLTKASGSTYLLTFHQTREVLTFDSGGHLTTDTDKNGNSITFSYNSSHQLTSITDTQGRSTTFSYNAAGQITTITDASGRTVQYGYDSSTKNLTSATDAAGKTTSFGYDPTSGLLTTITDPLSQGTTLSYDSSKRVATLTDATTAKTTFTYVPKDPINPFNGPHTIVTDANTHQTTYYYDSLNRVTKIVDALGHFTTYTYDPNFDTQQYTDALGNLTQLAYDGTNNLTSITLPTIGTISLSYTDSTNPYFPTSATDAQGNTLYYTYDAHGNLIKVSDGLLGGHTLDQYTYNANGTLASMTDPDGNQTSYGYDAHGNQTSITHPSPLGGESFSYDTLSRVSTFTDGLNQQTGYTHDTLDRLTKLTYAGGITVSSVYDADGNLTSMTDPTGTTSSTYDAANRVLTRTLPGGAQLTYTYDAAGNVTSYTDGGGKVSYAYNEINKLVTLTEPGGAKSTFGYDANEDLTSVTYPNGVSMTLSYQAGPHQVTGITATRGSTTLTNFTYSYKGSLIGSMIDAGGNTTTYTYDTRNRLTEASTTGLFSGITDLKYGYDQAGNRTSSSVTLSGTGTPPATMSTTYSYNAANELTSRLQGSTTTTYSYDANGNLTGASSGATLAYNALNQTTSISGNTFTYRGADQTERTKVNSTSFISSYNGITSQSDASGITYYTRCSCAMGTLVDERTPSGTYYYLFDGLGSIVGLTDSNGTLVATYAYDPFGNLTSSSGTVANPWRFAAGYYDSGTGLYKFGTRYYDSTLGRWSQQDPLSGKLTDPNSLNRYLYVSDDPVNFTDPSGRYQGLFGCVWDAIVAVVGVISGLYLFIAWLVGITAKYEAALLAAGTITETGEIIGLMALELGPVLLTAGEVAIAIVSALGLLAAAYVLAEVIAKCGFHEGEG